MKKFIAFFKESFPKEYGKIRFPDTTGYRYSPTDYHGQPPCRRRGLLAESGGESDLVESEFADS